VLTLESGILVALVVVLLYADLTAPAGSASSALAVTLYVATIAALLVFVTVSLARQRAWARGPAVVLNLLLLPIGASMMAGSLPWVGLPLIVIGLCGAGLLLAPGTRAALLVR
jgi:hypothetical protein